MIEFWSCAGFSGFLAGLIRELNALGYQAKTRFQISESSYRATKSPRARLFLRFRQYIVYPAQLVTVLLVRRMVKRGRVGQRTKEVCVVSTNTFYAPLIATYLHPNVVHLVYDLFPEAMIHSGKWTAGMLRVRLVRWVAKQTFKRAKMNVFLGKRLKGYVESIYGPVDNSAIIEVGADQAIFERSPKERMDFKGVDAVSAHFRSTLFSSHSAPTVLYCGNFGNMHDSATLFQYWNKVASRNDTPLASNAAVDRRSQCHFKFCCSGPKRPVLESTVQQLPEPFRSQITVSGGLSQEEWVSVMEQADVALVTMTPGAQDVVVPSKVYSAMMAGQAILAIAPEGSDLVDLIKAANCGWWVEPGDVDVLGKAIAEITANRSKLLDKRERSFHYAHESFGQDSLAKLWVDVFDSISGRSEYKKHSTASYITL